MPYAANAVTLDIARLAVRDIDIERLALIGPLLRSTLARDDGEPVLSGYPFACSSWRPDDGTQPVAVGNAGLIGVPGRFCMSRAAEFRANPAAQRA